VSDDRTGDSTPRGARPRRGRGPGRRPRPAPDASDWAWTVWQATEDVADLLDQYPEGEERERAASLMYRDADGTVRTRHRLLRAVSTDGVVATPE
jgi:hypothetical protein